MRILPAAATSLTALLLLNSCSGPSPLEVFNNTDQPLQVVLFRDAIVPNYVVMEAQAHSLALGTGRDNGKGPPITASTPCTLTFPAGSVEARIAAEKPHSGPTDSLAVPAQLEPDLNLYFMPRSVLLPATPADIEAARAAGKFLRPEMSNCGLAQSGQSPGD